MSKKKAQQVRPLGRSVVRRLRKELDHGAPLSPITSPFSDGPGSTDVATAIRRFGPVMPWKKARDVVLPMMPRIRPFPGPQLELVRQMLPPGILVSFGIDIGPAVVFVGQPLLGMWGIDPPTMARAAVANVRRLAELCLDDLVLHDRIADVPVAVLQTRIGIASPLLLVPDCLERFFGPGPRLLLAPMRDILIALPIDVDRDFATWLAEEWEDLDPNCLHLGAFRYERGIAIPEPGEEMLARA